MIAQTKLILYKKIEIETKNSLEGPLRGTPRCGVVEEKETCRCRQYFYKQKIGNKELIVEMEVCAGSLST